MDIATKEGMAVALLCAARVLSCKAACGPTVEQQYWDIMQLALHDDRLAEELQYRRYHKIGSLYYIGFLK